MHCDSDSIIKLGKNLVYHEKTNHVGVDCSFSREKIEGTYVALAYTNI